MYAKLKPSVIEAILCGKTEGGAAVGLQDSFLQAKNGMGISLVFAISDAVFNLSIVKMEFTIETIGISKECSVKLVHYHCISSFLFSRCILY